MQTSMGLVDIPERALKGLQWKDVLTWLKAKEEQDPDQLNFPVMVPLGEQIFVIDPSDSEDNIFGKSIEIAPFFAGWYKKRKGAMTTHLVRRGDEKRRPICKAKISKPAARFTMNPHGETDCEGCRKIMESLDDDG